MFHMLTAFNLKPNVSVEQFREHYAGFVDHMVSLDLVAGSDPIGKRVPASPLDTVPDRPHQFFALMHFSNQAQAERAYDWIKSHGEPTAHIHIDMWQLATDMEFLAWQDV